MDVKGKVVMITGASSGIGKALAQNLSARGAKLVLVARRGDLLTQLAAELLPANPDVLAVTADVVRQETLAAAVAQAIDRFGRLDILVNNAGLGYFGPLATMSMVDFDRVVRTNLHGVMYATQAALPHLKQSRGMVVNVSSGLSKRALPFLSAYAGTKSMLDALSDGMRMEFRKYGIHVLNYCPPEVETEFAQQALKSPGMERAAAGHPRKMAKAVDVAERMARAISANKREIVEGKALWWMDFFAPKLVDNIFYRAMVLRMLKD